MGATVYSIRDWNEHFEIAQSRKVEGPMAWVALPTKHDGKGYRRIMLRPDGLEVYGAWVLIVQVAAKCPTRGILADADGPLTVEDLAIKTSRDPSDFAAALQVLCSKEIGWMQSQQMEGQVVAGWESSGRPLPPQDRTGQDITNNLCGEDATTGTAKATGSSDGSDDGSSARAKPNGHIQAGDADEATEQATDKANGKGYPAAFLAFWDAYPMRRGRKRGQRETYDLWRQAIREADRQPLIEAARTFANSQEARDGFAKDPVRFLKKDWWRDWIPALTSPAKPPKRDDPNTIRYRIFDAGKRDGKTREQIEAECKAAGV